MHGSLQTLDLHLRVISLTHPNIVALNLKEMTSAYGQVCTVSSEISDPSYYHHKDSRPPEFVKELPTTPFSFVMLATNGAVS